MLFFPEDARLYGFRHFKTSKQGETQCEILLSGLQWEWIAGLDSWGRGHGRCTVDRGFLSVRDLARVRIAKPPLEAAALATLTALLEKFRQTPQPAPF